MEWNDILVDGQHTVKFTDLPYVPLTSSLQSADADELLVGKKPGGLLRHGEWAWLARNSVLQIVSLRNGQSISSYEFCESRGYENCCIKSVEEMFPNNPNIMLLSVVLESFHGAGGSSYIAIYSIESSSVLSSIELSLHLTCARFMNASACRRSLLQNFDGCLALGTEEGVIVLLDMNIGKLRSMPNESNADIFVPCHIVDYSLPITDIHRIFRQCQQDGVHFGLQMEVIESPCAIQSILPIDLILGLAIGLEDGRLALYDLAELQIFYVALPNPEVAMSALVGMDYLEPSDDPRPCVYIWALHENGENLHAVLHSLMYEKRVIGEDNSNTYFESFRNSSVRLQLPLEATKSAVLACQAITTFSNHGEDDSNCLCAISWLSVLEGKNKLLIFDLNQWYKEEMPYMVEYGKQPNYLAGYILNGEYTGLQTLLNSNNIAHFNSMQRFEEHFYPNSLSFESLLLHTEGCRRYNWEGVQNRVINLLRSSNAAIFLEPNLYFNEILRTRLMPQFVELNVNSTFSRNAKYEILLSVALEHNCVSLLRDCAKSWIDGSFMGNFSASTGLSLSTLTDWIWKRAACIKTRCNDLCKNLFEFGGYPLDNREQKELCFITRQLKLLSDLLKEILSYAKKQIPERVLNDLENKHSSLLMASSYQDILLWLLNIGFLPEVSPHNDEISANKDLPIYPYKELNEFYGNKRLLFAKINETFISKKSGSCKLLFIDSFIEHSCKGNILHEYWLENEGNGLYPPTSLETMLRVMLVPDLDYDNKCTILLYFFLDLNMAIDHIYKDVVENFIKFPSVFKLSAPLIKTVQAFWNLDHDHYLPAVDEFISPFNKNQCYPQWQVELFIEVLLNQNASNLALRILESQPSLISPLLKLNTLLANGLISEAFHFVRFKNDDTLLETFFNRCLCNGQFGVIRDLALSDREGLILQNILKKSKAPGAESLHFVYLLQKSKYLEAVSYMEELSNKAKCIKSSLQLDSQMDTPNLVLSAFNTTMTPVTQGLTDVYFRIKNKIKKKEVDNKSPVPLSCQLIKQNANGLLGGIYHSSALSAHFATYYWGEMEEQTKQTKHLLNANNAPFLRRPQVDTNCIDYLAKNNISYPQPYKAIEKRTLMESGLLDNEHDEFERHKLEHKLNPKKKRRLIGQEFVEDLTHFMKINKNTNSLNVSEFAFDPEPTSSETEQRRKNSLDLLTCPLMNKPVKEIDATVISVQEIHGILKTHTPDLGQQQREPLIEEEKNLRFELPPMDVSAADVMQQEDESEDIDIDDNEKTRKLTKVTSSVLDESNKSSASSISNLSEENFYSPLSSQNNSKLDCSDLSKYSFLSGPQPRKPLARFSAERSDKSLTPEPETKAADGSVIIIPRTSPRSTALESTLKSKIYPRSSLDPLKKSNEAEGFDSKGWSNDCYVTAKDSAFLSKISSIKSLGQLNADQVKDVAAIESSNEVYTTVTEAISKKMTYSTIKFKEDDTQPSSVFGSNNSPATFVGSKINEFSPQISSSKVGTSPVNVTEENKPPSALKLSECSTVLGSLTTFESTNTGLNIDRTKSDFKKPTEEQKRQMLETTLSMSSYDVSILDSTSPQQTKSSLMATSKDATFKKEFAKADENKTNELVEKCNQETECEEQQENKDYSEQKNDNVAEIQKVTSEESNYECIVLSSSSSSSSSQLSQEQEENDDINYSERDLGDEIDNYDSIEVDENFNFGESNTSDITNEENYDYDDGDYNKELSMDESDNSSNIENEAVIQFIEDSSSDIRQQQGNYYGESDSDDVKVVEDEQLSLTADNIETPFSQEREDETKQDTATNIAVEETADLKDLIQKEEEEYAIKIITATTDKTISTPANLPGKDDSLSVENSKQLTTSANNLFDIDIRFNENLRTSAIGVTTEKKLQEDSKQKDFRDIAICKDQDKKEDVSKVEQRDTESDLRGVSEPKSVENSETLKKNTEMIKIDEAKEEPITLRRENLINDSEIEIERKLEIKVTIETEATNKSEEKSLDVIKTESEEQEKKEQVKVENIPDDSPVTPIDIGHRPVETVSCSQEKLEEEKSELVIEEDKISEVKVIENVKTPQRKRKTSRGSSAPPIDLEHNPIAAVSSPRRNTRSISVPPQTITESEEVSNLTPRSRRGIRATSLQPKYKMEGIGLTTPRKSQKTQDKECAETRATRGSSLPPIAVVGKPATRRLSVLLDDIDEDPVTLDSPSARTRLKSRLSSMESELDSPIVGTSEQVFQQKRNRKMSMSNELTLTPKRIRRDSINSQPEGVATPRSLRSRSVLSVQEEDTESLPVSPSPVSSKRSDMKRKKLIKGEAITETKEQIEQISPKSDQSALSDDPYSSSRRMTRTQLAIMEKSVALSQKSTKDHVTKEAISSPSNKRATKSRSKRSSNVNADSDDAESVSSKLSTTSSVTGTKRRVTRSSIKGKDDADDDGVSVASSLGSEKHGRTRSSKDKGSPNTTLTTIPEEAPVETKKRGRPTKH